jgi:hypothetical protein
MKRRQLHQGILALLLAWCASSWLPTAAQELPTPQITAEVDGTAVTLRIAPPGAAYFLFVVEAGSAPGLTDLFNGEVMSSSPSFVAFNGVPPGRYYVRIRGKMPWTGRISERSNEVEVNVAGCSEPPVVGNFAGRTLGDSVVLTWIAPGSSCGPSTYTIEAGSTSGGTQIGVFPIGQGTGTGPDRALIADRLAPGDYFLRIRATRAGVTGPPSPEVALNIGCPPPKTVLDLQAKVTGNSVEFSWRTDGTWVTDHSAVLEVGSGPGLANLASIPAPDRNGGAPYFTYGAIGPPGTYYVRIRTTSRCGTKVSNEIVVTLGSTCAAPGFPAGIDAHLFLAASPVLPKGLLVNWSLPASGGVVTSYTVEAGSEPGQSDLGRRVVDGTALSVVFEDLLPPKAYARVRASNPCGEGPWSNDAVAVGGSCPNPQRPFLFVEVRGSSVQFRWGGYIEGSIVYPTFVEVGSTPFARDVFVGPVHSIFEPFETITLAPGTYYARTRSVASCGQVSNASNEVAFSVGGADNERSKRR